MKLKAPETVFSSAGFCPGCGHGLATRLIGEVSEELGIQEKMLAVVDVACCSFNIDYWRYDTIMAAHGRDIPTAVGVKHIRPENPVFAYLGDGAAYSIGMAETIHAALRNDNICVFVVNNSVFGMTGGQTHRAHAHHGNGAFRLLEELDSGLNVARDAGGEGEFDDVRPVGAGLLFLFPQVVHARRDLKVMGGADDEDAAVGGFHDQFSAVAHGLDFNVDGRGVRHVRAEQGEALLFRHAAQTAFLMAADGDQQRHVRPEFHDLFRRELRGQRIHAQFHPVALVFQILTFKRFPDLPGGDGRHYVGRVGLMFT